MPGIVHKFRAHGDAATAQLLEDVVYRVRSLSMPWVPTGTPETHLYPHQNPNASDCV